MTATTVAAINELAPNPVLHGITKAGASMAAKTRRPNNIVWFELPVNDLERAVAFYEALFLTELRLDPQFPELAIFPRRAEDSVTGALIADGVHQPSDKGAIVYLNCDGELDRVLARVETLGGSVLQEVAQLPGGLGWIAQIRDVDGNRVGLHANY